MKKWIAILGLLLPLYAGAQTGAITNYCVLGATPATVSGLNSSNNLQGIIPQCTVTVYLDGYNSVKSGKYTSGGTVTGTSGKTCVATFVGGLTDGTATIALTGTNTIAANTAFVITTGGIYATAPTTATLSSGTATCSGTATVSVVMTPALATIYSDKSSTTLTNPFTANSDGSWLFYAAVNQGYDVKLSGGVSPNVYPSSVTLTGLFPGAGAGSGCGAATETVCDTTYGGTGINSSASTGVAQVSAGIWSISTALANGTTATTQTTGDTSTDVATDAFVGATAGNYLPLAGGTLTGALDSTWSGVNTFSGIIDALGLNGTIGATTPSTGAFTSITGTSITDSTLTTAGYVTNTSAGVLGTTTTIPVAALSYDYTTVNGTTCTLGSTCTVTAVASGITVGTTTVGNATNGYILYDNSGVLGNLATTGSGSVVLATSPSIFGLNVTASFTATGLVTNADLVYASTTVNGETCTLGSSCTVTASNPYSLTMTDGASSSKTYNGSAAITLNYLSTTETSLQTIASVLEGSSDIISEGFLQSSCSSAASADLCGGVNLQTSTAQWWVAQTAGALTFAGHTYAIGSLELYNTSYTPTFVSDATRTAINTPLDINLSSVTATNYNALSVLEPSLSTGNGVGIEIGTANSAYNYGLIAFNNAGGSGSTSNFVSMSLYDKYGVVVFGSGDVSIGSTTDCGVSLCVNGSSLAATYAGTSAAIYEATQGAYIAWDYTSGSGETDFINNSGTGSPGGFSWYNTTSSSAPTVLMNLTLSGALYTTSINSSFGIVVGQNSLAGTYPFYVCTTAGTLPAGAITMNSSSCGSATSTGYTLSFNY